MLRKLATSPLRWLRSVQTAWLMRRHQPVVTARAWQENADYARYLTVQLQRTLPKKAAPLPARAQALIDQVASQVELTATRVLCVGCRNDAELSYFRQQGAQEVIGIDLYSEQPDILVMDMHRMDFPDSHFDLLYSSHSLEHSFDPQQAIAEFVRVVRNGGMLVVEVPVRYQRSEADRVDFASLENLHQSFAPHVAQVLWSATTSAGDFGGQLGVDAIRTIIQIRK